MTVKALLYAFQTAFPNEKAPHKITLDRKDQLVLSLILGDKWHDFILEDIDFQRQPVEVVEEIKGFLAEDGHLQEPEPVKPVTTSFMADPSQDPRIHV